MSLVKLKSEINKYIPNEKGKSSVSGYWLNVLLNKVADLAGGPDFGTYTSYRREFTEAEVKTLFSANGGFGYELFSAPGGNKHYQIINPIFTFKIDPSGTIAAGNIHIYPTTGNSSFQQPLSGVTSIPGETRIYQPQLKDSNPAGKPGEAQWLWLDVESPNYKGTLVVTFDYKLIDGDTI